ncbi:MAG: ribosome maturation factor RimM [Cyclobacteriaceae bacterium]|nr:16S rRNA processing protein RimM [Cyclobacteriaceae bacterium]MCH8515420.1 ribosome maturation factor RimM [Cyclobacteriaceae bacterium]
MKAEDCFELGTLGRPNGLKGGLNAVLDTDNPEAYTNLESVLILRDQDPIPFFIEEIRINGKKAFIKFEDFESKDEAAEWVGAKLLLPLSALPPIEGGFYYHEIVGYQVIDAEKGELGTIQNVIDASAQALLVMDYQEKEVLIPMVDELIQSVDKDTKVIHLRLPEGLLELYL